MKIGVFDSGVGGLSVAMAIKKSWPEHEVILKEDKENLPYGLKTPDELLGLVTPILQSLEADGCRVIVIACNTVTTSIIDELRRHLKVPLLGVEPMVKLASGLTSSHVIAVCATPTTLGSQRYRDLKETYAKHLKVYEPDCSDWALMIETNQIDHDTIRQRIEEVLAGGSDIILLACTHYHWIKDEIKRIAAGRAQVLDPEWWLLGQLKAELERLP